MVVVSDSIRSLNALISPEVSDLSKSRLPVCFYIMPNLVVIIPATLKMNSDHVEPGRKICRSERLSPP